MKVNKKYIYIISVLAFIILFAVIDFNLFSSKKQEKEMLQEKIYNYQKILCKKKSIVALQKKLKLIDKPIRNMFIYCKSKSDASIKFQDAISSISEGIDISIDRFEAPRIRKEKDVQFIAMKIFFSGRISPILKFIYRIENSKRPYFIVDSITIRKLTKRRNELFFRYKGFLLVKSLVKIKEV